MKAIRTRIRFWLIIIAFAAISVWATQLMRFRHRLLRMAESRKQVIEAASIARRNFANSEELNQRQILENKREIEDLIKLFHTTSSETVQNEVKSSIQMLQMRIKDLEVSA